MKKILLCALFLVASAAPFAVAAPGDLDPSFSGDGKRTTHFNGRDWAHDALALRNGRIVVVGDSNNVTNADFTVARYRPNGSLDTSFSGDGKRVVSVGRDDTALAVARQRNGKIVLAGSSTPPGGGPHDVALVRLHPDGGLDKTFSGDGMLRTDLGAEEEATDVEILPNGKILVSGDRQGGSGEFNFVVLRYNPSGKLDTKSDANPKSHFSGNGWRMVDFPGANDDDLNYGLDVREGKITVAGASGATDTGTDFAFARLRPKGAFDKSFSGDGRKTVDFTGDYDAAYDAKVLRNGKVVAVGQVGLDPPTSRFGFLRLTANGSLDPTFSGDGRRAIALDGGADGGRAFSLEIQNGKYAAVGQSFTSECFAVVRLTRRGKRDVTFGTQGEVETTIGSSSEARGSALDPAGRLIAVGQARVGGQDDWAIARYLP